MKKENLKINVLEDMFDEAKAGNLVMITSNIDAEADKKLLEGLKPDTVTIKARGTRKHAVTFSVTAVDRVRDGYKVESRNGTTIMVMSRLTGRVHIGDIVDLDNSEKATDEPAENIPKKG